MHQSYAQLWRNGFRVMHDTALMTDHRQPAASPVKPSRMTVLIDDDSYLTHQCAGGRCNTALGWRPHRHFQLWLRGCELPRSCGGKSGAEDQAVPARTFSAFVIQQR